MRLPILVLHICAGTLGLLSGAAAMTFRKGSRGHRIAGNAFVLSMLTMGAGAVYLAVLKSQVTNIFGGLLTFYMVGTAWATARRKDTDKDGETRLFDWCALLLALAVGGSQITFGVEAALSPTGLKYGYPAGMFVPMGVIVLIAAAGDVRMLARGGIHGTRRIARHLWRMCFGLFIASGSLFLGQQQVFPAALRGTSVLLFLAFLPLLLLIFWMIRVRMKSPHQRILMREASA
jgi:uncharacterized membrane protein